MFVRLILFVIYFSFYFLCGIPQYEHNIPQFLYPFYCWWIFTLLPSSWCTYIYISDGFLSRSNIVGASSYISALANTASFTKWLCGCTNLQSHQQCLRAIFVSCSQWSLILSALLILNTMLPYSGLNLCLPDFQWGWVFFSCILYTWISSFVKW